MAALLFALLAGGIAYGTSAAVPDGRIAEVQRLTDQALQLRREAKLTEAIAVWKRRSALVREIMGSDSNEAVAGSQEILAQLQEANNDYTAAARARRQTWTIRAGLLGAGHWKVTDARLAMEQDERTARMSAEQRQAIAAAEQSIVAGYKAHQQKDETTAIAAIERGLEVQRQILGPQHPAVGDTLNMLGSIYQGQGDFASTRRYYEQVVAVRKATLGEEHPQTGWSMHVLGTLFNGAAMYDEAQPLLERALAIFLKTVGEAHEWTLLSLESLGSLLPMVGDYGGARGFRERVLQIQRRLHGEDSPEVAAALNLLGRSYSQVGNGAAARPLLEKSLATYRKVRPADHPDIAQALDILGQCAELLEQPRDARRLYEEAYEIRRRSLGDENMATAASLLVLARLHDRTRDVQQEQRDVERALAVYRRAKASDSLIGSVLNQLADVLDRAGKPDEALACLEESLALYARKFGENSYEVSRIRRLIASAYASMGRLDEALKLADQARRSLRAYHFRLLWGLSDAEQLSVLHLSDEFPLHQSLSLGLHWKDDPAVAERTAEWLQNGKAVAEQAVAERTLLARDSKDPRVGRLIDELRLLREQLAALANQPSPPAIVQRRRTDLERHEDELVRQLGQLEVGGLQDSHWVELDRVRQALPADSVLVNIARIRPYDFRARGTAIRWNAARYVAWLVPASGRGPVRVVDLGEAEPIETEIAAVRAAVAAAAGEEGLINQQGEAEAAAQFRKPIDALSRRVLHPLLDGIGSAPHWIFSPDSDLWLIPWAALPLPDGAFALERHKISFAANGREYAAPRTTPPTPASAQGTGLVMADPDFDLDLARIAAPVSPPLDNRIARRGPPQPPRLSPSTSWPRLFGSADEVKAIVPKVSTYLKGTPLVLTGDKATEAGFKASRRPRVVVLSTHGYFLSDPPAASDESVRPVTEADAGVARPTENPLLRCGLVLAGANLRNREAGRPKDDGLLTGLEIVGTDLRGTELVVLSACDTGVGRVHNGEGVANLRQAFQLAGARGVVSTLWKIPDLDTADLMTAFWADLAAGASPADALRNAQLSIFRSHRAKEKASHPYFWAAFTLSGPVR